MVHRICVRFAGQGSGVGPLSWGQLTLFEAMSRLGTWLPIGGVDPLPPGTTVEDIAEQLRFWISRHQSMRTRLRFDPDGPRQVVFAEGETGLEIVDAADHEDPVTVAEQVERRFRETPFDFTADWPMRMAVVRHRGAPTHQVLIACHLISDAAGARVMRRELAARDPETGAAATPPARMQPLAQARWQHSPAGRRQSQAAIRYIDNIMRTMPPRRFCDPSDPRQPRYWRTGFRSPAMHLAIRAIGARTGVTSPSILLNLFAIALARVSHTNPAVMHVLVNNRFRPELADVVAPHSQGAVFSVDVAETTFDEALARTRRRSLAAYKYSYYDPDQKEGMEERIGRERGEELVIGAFFNDRRLRTLEAEDPAVGGIPVPSLAEVRAALPATTLACESEQEDPFERLLLHVNDVPDTIDMTAEYDTHHLPPARLEALLREMEAVAVEAAFDGAASTRVPVVVPA